MGKNIEPKSIFSVYFSDAEIMINCTSIGMSPKTNASPIERIPDQTRVVFDTIYNPRQTLLLHRALQRGCLTVSGVEMFLNQGSAQFTCWTNQPAPAKTIRRIIGTALDA